MIILLWIMAGVADLFVAVMVVVAVKAYRAVSKQPMMKAMMGGMMGGKGEKKP